jgi:alcohol dehydrogenase (NADP+)
MDVTSKERQTAIVTGASSGIGLGITQALIERSLTLFLKSSQRVNQSRNSKGYPMASNHPSNLRFAKIPLNFGTGTIPALGFGTLIPDPAETRSATTNALRVGFRHFDCAERYRNEREVGESLQAEFATGAIAREDVFITTKLWNTNHRPERVEPAFDASRERLGISYRGVNLLETWRAMESLADRGKCRAIGLSDVVLENLVPLYEAARIKPAVVQVESHPYLPQTELLDFCKQKGIVFLAFAPLGHGILPGPLQDPAVLAIARQTSLTPAQVLLAWAIQRGTAVLTTPKTPDRARENYNISEIPEVAVDEINRIQIRSRLNSVIETGVPGFIAKGG